MQNAFEGRSNLPSKTLDFESDLLLTSGPKTQTDLLEEVSEKIFDPLSSRQTHQVESFQSDLALTQKKMSHDSSEILSWDDLSANNLRMSLDEPMPLQLNISPFHCKLTVVLMMGSNGTSRLEHYMKKPRSLAI